MMNGLFRKYWYLTVVAVLFFASASFAQTTTTMDLTSPGNGTTLGNVYVDPYTATVGGVANTTVICDDWSNNSYLNESWTANVNTISSLGGKLTNAPMFGNNQPLYNELAWLGSQLLANYAAKPTLAQQAAQTEISFAIWELTYGVNGTTKDSTAPAAYLSEYLSGGTSNAEYIAAQTYLCEATGGCQGYAGEAGYNASGWEILTPNSSDPICNGGPCPSSPAQEFLLYTPESSATILFGADMLGLLGLAIVFRRRLLRPIL